ncbi:MAG: DUF6158 family protein, partial [Micromonosporaceae bacterium]
MTDRSESPRVPSTASDWTPEGGVPAETLSNEDLLRELESLARTRFSTLRHGSDAALAEHDRRTDEMEAEYLRRFPDREVDPE